MEIYYCPVNCVHLQKGKKSLCKLGYENMGDPNSEPLFDQPTRFIRPDRCVQDELAERETFER